MTDDTLTETERSYREFFGDLVAAYADHRSGWTELQVGPRNYLTFSAGTAGVSLGWVFHKGPEFAVELYISTPSAERNEAIFQRFYDQRETIESTLDAELVWERLSEKQACRIKFPREIDGRITELTTDQRRDLVAWGVEAMDRFQDEFEPRVTSLDVSEL